MEGFFNLSTIVSKAPPITVPHCGACKLFKHCKSPKMPVSGKGKKGILIIGGAPNSTEDAQGRHFVGPEGDMLQSKLRKYGIDMRNDCWLTNSLICYSSGKSVDKQIDFCRPNLTKAIKECEPDVIIPLGSLSAHDSFRNASIKSLIGSVWKEDVGGFERWMGFSIPCQTPNAWIAPTFHPSYVKRALDKSDGKVVELVWERHLEAACKLKGKPWKELPDYEGQVQKIFNPDEAAKRILAFIDADRPVAFDFETNAKKPEIEGAKIICCGVSNGVDTIAFPWKGPVVGAMEKLLRSHLLKYGYNMKFEQRWVKRLLGYEVKNWAYCGMTGAHVIDNRTGITGLKFQAFVMLGAMSYDDAIAPFLKGYKGSSLNRIHEIEIGQLLGYAGVDALLEWLVAKKHNKIIPMALGGGD